MLKKSLTLIAFLSALPCHAALDINKASEADFDSSKGIGPDTSSNGAVFRAVPAAKK